MIFVALALASILIWAVVAHAQAPKERPVRIRVEDKRRRRDRH